MVLLFAMYSITGNSTDPTACLRPTSEKRRLDHHLGDEEAERNGKRGAEHLGTQRDTRDLVVGEQGRDTTHADSAWHKHKHADDDDGNGRAVGEASVQAAEGPDTAGRDEDERVRGQFLELLEVSCDGEADARGADGGEKVFGRRDCEEQAEREDTREEEQHLVLHPEIVAAPVALGNLEQRRCEEARSKWRMRGDESRGN
eukprot:2061234-Rhodomonas_salina.2